MSFMEPDIQRADYFRVETNTGTETVPADLIRVPFVVDFRAGGVFTEDSPHWAALTRALSPYVDGWEITEVSSGRGFIARLSAPGYMDCTDWSVHETEEEAREYLAGIYGDDDDEGEL